MPTVTLSLRSQRSKPVPDRVVWHCQLGADGAFSPSRSSAVVHSAGGRHRIPFNERPRSEQAVVNRPQEVSADTEEILYHAVYGREALQMGSRLEAAHLTLALLGRLMRDLGTVVRVPIGAVAHRRHHRAACCRVAAELVCDQPSWDTTLALEELPEESGGCAPIPSRLHEDVDDVAVLVHGAPQILLATMNRYEQLVQMPGVTHPTAAAPKTSRVHRAEPLTPLPDGFIGDRDVPLGQQVLHISEAETESVVEPDGVADDFGRESIAG